jgi:RimJ/RimL family protein N-acetyltransferase
MFDEILAEEYPKQITLKNSAEVTIRLLSSGDTDALYQFFQSISRDDRMFLRDNVRDKSVIEGWCRNMDLEHVIPVLALVGDKIVAEASLHRERHGWKSHIGKLRLVVHKDFRRQGLAVEMVKEVIEIALHTGSLEQLNAECMVDTQQGAIRMLELLGFIQRAILPGQVKDIEGRTHDLTLLSYELRDQEFHAID